MFFLGNVDIPAGTAKKSPRRFTVQVTIGTLKRVWVRWRWGPGNLCGCRILYHEFQHWPLSLGKWFPSTTEALDFHEEFDVLTEPVEFVVESYNLDTRYPHNVWVAFEIEREPVSVRRAGFIQRLIGRERGE